MNEEANKPEEAQAKETKPAEEKPSSAEKKEEAASKKKKKINRLTLKELEKRLEEAAQKMKGMHSTYAQQLLRQKEKLISAKDRSTKEAVKAEDAETT